MPYRRLPNTDIGRLFALDAAEFKANNTDPLNLAFSSATKTRLDTFLPNFRTQMGDRNEALAKQTAATLAATTAKQTQKMFNSHFIQVFNMGVLRGVHPASERAYFNLDVNTGYVPSMTNETDINNVADEIVDGEATRVANGGTAMANPSAAEVDAVHTDWDTKRATQSTERDQYDQELEDVEACETKPMTS